jgi:exodeoxyribonuclease VII small subunit
MAKKGQTPPKNFEDALAELERILSSIEGGDVPLEQSLTMYERGQFLIQHCRGVLGAAEKQIEMLSKNADGGLESSPQVASPAQPSASGSAASGESPEQENET